jgi:TRAP-type mannitol/chloroaromatic compound transport system permease small subunit
MPMFLAFARYIDRINERLGQIGSFLILPMMAIVVYEVVGRYVFNRPTIWAHESSEMLFGVFCFLALAYTHRLRAHVNVDTLYKRFSLRSRAIIDLITSIFFFFFCGVVLWKAAEFAMLSLSRGEHSQTPFGPPLYPVKCLMWLGFFLLTLQGLAKFIRDLDTAWTGRETK